MKKITGIILLTTLLAGCYEDKGNYDYKLDRMNEITDISFTPAITETADGRLIELQQAMNEENSIRRVEANVSQTLAENYDKLHFYWYITHTAEDGKIISDTIETNGYLEVKLPVGKEILYDVYLQVYDTETTLSRYSNFKIKTRPMFKNSLFVLHGKEGNRKLGNIEIIGTDTLIYTDAHKIIKPNEINPFTNAEALTYSTYFDVNGNDQKESYNLSVFSFNSDATVYDPYGLNIKFSKPMIFKPSATGSSFVFNKNIQTGEPSNGSLYRVVLSRDGKFLLGNSIPALYKPGYGIETNGGNAEHLTDYRVTAATITENRFVLWDAKYNRFIYVSKNEFYPIRFDEEMNNTYAMLNNPVYNANVDFSSLEKSPAGMTAVYAYIQYRENYSVAKPYFIFKDEATNEFWRYELTQLSTGDSKNDKSSQATRAEAPQAAFSITGERMKNFEPGENLNTIVYNSWFTTNTLFYADGGTVYRYNVSNGDKTTIYKAPEGYTISLLKFRTEDSEDFSGDLGRYLSIGMNKGDEGAIAEIILNTASDIDEDIPTTFYDKDNEGNKFGNIKDLQFTQIYTYKVPVY